MRRSLVVLLLVGAVTAYFTWTPSAVRIAQEMTYYENGRIAYRGCEYSSHWGADEEIQGHLRMKDRHYDKNMPVVTYDLIMTWGEFSDPEVVQIESRGGGNYYWRSKKKPVGSLVVYHVVPKSEDVQRKLDGIAEGGTVRLFGRPSENNEIRGDDGSIVRLGHDNHKFILLEGVSEPASSR